MIARIRCDAHACVHNKEGACASGVVDIQYYAGPAYGAAYCNSYACAGSFRCNMAQDMPAAATAINMLARHNGMSEQNTLLPTDYISCTAEDCAYNRSNRCFAEAVHIAAPASGSTLSLCKTYTK